VSAGGTPDDLRFFSAWRISDGTSQESVGPVTISRRSRRLVSRGVNPTVLAPRNRDARPSEKRARNGQGAAAC